MSTSATTAQAIIQLYREHGHLAYFTTLLSDYLVQQI